MSPQADNVLSRARGATGFVRTAECGEDIKHDTRGVEAGIGIHLHRIILLDKAIRKNHRADFQAAIEEAIQGEVLEYAYQVRLIDPSYKVDLVDSIAKLPDASETSLVMQRTTVEI